MVRPLGELWPKLTDALLAGLATLVVADASGLLTLLGDPRQIPYVLPPVIVAGFLYAWAGARVARRGRAWAYATPVLALALSLALLLWNLLQPVASDEDLIFRSLLVPSANLPLAVWGVRVRGLSESRRSHGGLIAVLGAGTLLTALVYTVIYYELDFEYFPTLVLFTESFAALVLLAPVLFQWRRARTGSGEDPERPAPTATAQPARRRLGRLQRLAVIGLCLLLGSALILDATSLDAPQPQTAAVSGPATTATPIRHLVEIMMENHAFDNVFGTYPSDPGGANATLEAALPQPEAPLDPAAVGATAVPNGTFTTTDPLEGYSAYHIDWDGGKMNGFLQGSGPSSLQYFTASQMAPEWDWAEEYAMGDNAFASELSETTPNRLYNLAGFAPVMNDYGPPPYIPIAETVFGELSAYGVSWGYYVQDPTQDLGPLEAIQGFPEPGPNLGSWQTFLADAAVGRLPAVSWVMPLYGGLDLQYSEEPPGSMLSGEAWLLFFVDSLMASPQWNSTAIIVTYDEGGGYYDPVAPPTLDGELLGQRLPWILISPYAKEAYITHTLISHTSDIALIDYLWGLPALNPLVADSGLPLDAFDFSSAYPDGMLARPPIPFTSAEGFPTPSSLSALQPGMSGPDLSKLFPQPLQIPLASRPYASTGSSSSTLASLGRGLWVSQDVTYYPWGETGAFLALTFSLEVAVWWSRPSGGRASSPTA